MEACPALPRGAGPMHSLLMPPTPRLCLLQDAVSLCDCHGEEFARALINYAQDEVDKVKVGRGCERRIHGSRRGAGRPSRLRHGNQQRVRRRMASVNDSWPVCVDYTLAASGVRHSMSPSPLAFAAGPEQPRVCLRAGLHGAGGSVPCEACGGLPAQAAPESVVLSWFSYSMPARQRCCHSQLSCLPWACFALRFL